MDEATSINPRIYQALVIAQGLELYSKTKIRVNRSYTPSAMLAMANKITGHVYRRGQYGAAASALREWAAREGQSKLTDDFIVEGVETDGSRTTLFESDNSGEARVFLRRYVASENAGNWDLIEIYDLRGPAAERVAFWERGEAHEVETK